jgi:hypothetical protein
MATRAQLMNRYRSAVLASGGHLSCNQAINVHTAYKSLPADLRIDAYNRAIKIYNGAPTVGHEGFVRLLQGDSSTFCDS